MCTYKLSSCSSFSPYMYIHRVCCCCCCCPKFVYTEWNPVYFSLLFLVSLLYGRRRWSSLFIYFFFWFLCIFWRFTLIRTYRMPSIHPSIVPIVWTIRLYFIFTIMHTMLNDQKLLNTDDITMAIATTI